MFCSKRANGNIFFFLSWNANTNKLQQEKKKVNKKFNKFKKKVVDVNRLRTGDEKEAV